MNLAASGRNFASEVSTSNRAFAPVAKRCDRTVTCSRRSAVRCSAAPTSSITTQEGEGRSLTISTTTAEGKGPGTTSQSLESTKQFLQRELASIFATGVGDLLYSSQFIVPLALFLQAYWSPAIPQHMHESSCHIADVRHEEIWQLLQNPILR